MVATGPYFVWDCLTEKAPIPMPKNFLLSILSERRTSGWAERRLNIIFSCHEGKGSPVPINLFRLSDDPHLSFDAINSVRLPVRDLRNGISQTQSHNAALQKSLLNWYATSLVAALGAQVSVSHSHSKWRGMCVNPTCAVCGHTCVGCWTDVGMLLWPSLWQIGNWKNWGANKI